MIPKIIFVTIGSIFLGIGAIGIIIPGLPSTPFFILSAAFYLRGSIRLHKWISEHRVFGKYLKVYQENKAMTLRSKITVLSIMWTMIFISSFLLIENLIIRWIILSAGVIGTIVITKIRTYIKPNHTDILP
jgi:uncharacterized membrane protein YbaN (DUF454 family)